MKHLTQRVIAVLLGLFVLVPGLPAAFALKTVEPPKDAKAIYQWIASVLVVGACAAIVFKNAKRTHQN